MGQFSWLAQDTNKNISCSNPKPITMMDNKGNKWTEYSYEGYGVFGGKDFYQLLAEMNESDGLTGNVDNDRDIGIWLFFDGKNFICPNFYEDESRKWENTIPTECVNQGR